MNSLESLPTSQTKVSWRELDGWAKSFFSDLPQLENILKENALNKSHLDYFTQKIKIRRPEDWLNIDPNKICGRIGMGVPVEITIHPLLSEYSRDKTLFHELCHTHYDKFIIPILFESLPEKEVRLKSGKISYLIDGLMFELVNENLIEWLARRHRADYVLLRDVVHSFELEPQIYDLPSYMAFASSFLRFGLELDKSRFTFNILMD